MKNVMKTATLESKFPLLSVENGCIISKDADITVAYRVELPELFTLTRAEYESMHSTWAKAVKVLPNYSIVHKQDFFIEEGYKPDICKEDLSFLSRSFERHFNEQCTYKGIHYPQGNAGQGNRHPVHGVLRTIRTHRERQRPATYHPPDG